MKVWIVTVKSWSGEGEPISSTTVDGVYQSEAAAKKSTEGQTWNDWREFEIEEHEVASG